VSCCLEFRHPRPKQNELNERYRSSPNGTWRYSAESRRDWAIAKRWISKHIKQGSVLDVGCYDGAFLSTLARAYTRYGIEISDKARQIAEADGTVILASDFEHIPQAPSEFDAVTAFDLLEHTIDPAAILSQMSRIARRGGFVIVSSGNTASWSWRLMGSRYWYAAIPEHQSFINPAWCRRTAASAGLNLLETRFFSHAGSVSLPAKLQDAGRNVAYRLVPWLFAWLRTKGYGGVDARTHPMLASTPPMWLSASDHLVALFQRL
jgi:2-polyprenyl-3-methyl-5-hydroxy-6-metoxy-1,4-benzoquinol methylase